MKGKLRQLIIHVTGGVIFLLLPIIFSPDLSNPVSLFNISPFQRDFISYVFLLLFFYLNFYLLLPKLYFQKKYVSYGFCILLCYVFVTFMPGLLIVNDNNFSFVPAKFFPPFTNFILFYISQHFFKFLIVLSFSLMLKINDRLKQAEKEKVNTELSFLKAQINPHFLFNTLNSIYALAIAEKAQSTATAIVKLSGMMRYVISETDENFVLLNKEINYISNYIDLQKNRFGNTVKINYSVTGDTEGKKIAPLLLIQFVENAFKHGVNAEQDSFIDIKINSNGKELEFYVANNKVNSMHGEKDKIGLGIENTKSRLQLLYADEYHLKIKNQPKEFSVLLTIQLR